MQMDDQDLKSIFEDLRFLIAEKEDAKLRNILLSMHPSDIAEVIEQLEEHSDRIYLFNLMSTELASETMIELDEVTRERLIDDLGNARVSELVDEMDSDDAADIVAELPKSDQEEILKNVEEEDEREVRELLRYSEDSAGRIMALEIVSVLDNSTVDAAINEIRIKAEEVEDIYNVYVVDRAGTLQGRVSMKNLILSKGHRPVSEIMDRDVVTVPASMDQEEVAKIAQRYNLVSVPVVDDAGKLLGRITIDDIVDVIAEEATEDIHKMAGLTTEEEPRQMAVFKIFRARIPWLVWGLVGGLIGAVVMYRFETSLEQEIVLTYFVPVIMAMAGNIGIQSSAIVVRGLATGEIANTDIARRVTREARVSLLNGFFLAALLFVVIAIGWHNQHAQPIVLASLISSALVIVILIAAFVGTLVPMVLKKMNIDPALATGPFITTSNDIIGLFIYLSIATLFLK